MMPEGIVVGVIGSGPAGTERRDQLIAASASRGSRENARVTVGVQDSLRCCTCHLEPGGRAPRDSPAARIVAHALPEW